MQGNSHITETISSNQQDQMIQQTVSKERSRLLSFIRKRIPSGADAEDILQDVFFELVESYRLTRPVEQLASWLFSVARNKITDLYRKQKPSSLEEEMLGSFSDDDEQLLLADILPANSRSADTAMWQEAVMDLLEEALEELPSEQKEVFMMHELEDLSFNEIAVITGVPLKTLISRKRYAVLYLRERLQRLYNDLSTN
jgi:RNA polymerase sigma factor (sigma-70 family)